jgi:hypothetical protein
MMRSTLVTLATAFGMSLLAGSCNEYFSCTDIGCQDSFNVTVKPLAGTFPEGEHEVTITAEGSAPRTCTFRFPLTGSAEFATCTGQGFTNLTVAPLQMCETVTSGNAVSQSCKPIPGKFQQTLSVPGLPARVRITQRVVGGAMYLDREATPTYENVYPNGRRCGAVCKQAGATWEF